MTELEDKQTTYAEKIALLLRKAENTTSEVEAELFTAKAQELMTKYAITEELLAKAEGRQVQDHVIQDSIVYRGIYQAALFNIGKAIAVNNNCKILIDKWSGGRNTTSLIVVGFSQDVARVQLLDASLQIQASTAMQRWYRRQDMDRAAGMQKYKARREFFFGFAIGVGQKLAMARRAGVAEAVKEESTRSGVAASDVRTSTELVLRTKDEQVKDWYDTTYGKNLRTVRHRHQSGGYSANSAGREAGLQSNVGQTGLGRTTKGAIG